MFLNVLAASRWERLSDKLLYRTRHLIENFVTKLKQYRAVATRYDKTPRNFLGSYTLLLLPFGLTDDPS